MPTMTHPETGASFDCPDNQVETWREAGWQTEATGKRKPSKPTDTEQPAPGDTTEE